MSTPEQPDTSVAGAGTAAPTLDEMAQELADAKIRSTLGDYERQLADMMAKAEAAFAQQQQQIDAQRQQLSGQIAAVRAQAGPPEALLLAESLAKRVQTIAASNPDIHPLHFHGVLDQAGRLHEAVQGTAKGESPVAEAERLAEAVYTWFTRTHPRASSKFLEGAHEALNEAERIMDLLPELAPVAEAIAAAI